MKVVRTNKVKMFQDGGAMTGDPNAAPMEGQDMGSAEAAGQPGVDPQQQIMQLANDIISQIGPEGAMMLAQAIMEMAQSASQGAPQGQPAFRRGGRLIGRIR